VPATISASDSWSLLSCHSVLDPSSPVPYLLAAWFNAFYYAAVIWRHGHALAATPAASHALCGAPSCLHACYKTYMGHVVSSWVLLRCASHHLWSVSPPYLILLLFSSLPPSDLYSFKHSSSSLMDSLITFSHAFLHVSDLFWMYYSLDSASPCMPYFALPSCPISIFSMGLLLLQML